MLSPEEYHATGVDNILRILKSDTINLSSGLSGNADERSKKMFFLSLSRTGSPKLAYGQKGSWFGRIVFNGAKLNHNYRSEPVDYWENKGQNPSGFEYEDRLITDKSVITQVSKYIIRIDILINDDMSKSAIFRIQEIIELGKSKGIAVNVYSNKNDLVKGVNIVNDRVMGMDTADKEGDYEWRGNFYKLDLNKLVALLMYDDRNEDAYRGNDGYNVFKNDLAAFLRSNNMPQVDEYKTFEYIRGMFHGERDFYPSLKANLDTYLKGGSSANDEDRRYIDLLAKDMRKWGVNNLKDLIRIKVYSLKPDVGGREIDYRGKVGLYRLGYNYDTEQYDTWEMVPYDRDLDKIGIYLNGYNYSGHLRGEDMTILFDMRFEHKKLGDFMNYMLNKYTMAYVVDIIHKSGWDSHYNRYEFKLGKV